MPYIQTQSKYWQALLSREVKRSVRSNVTLSTWHSSYRDLRSNILCKTNLRTNLCDSDWYSLFFLLHIEFLHRILLKHDASDFHKESSDLAIAKKRLPCRRHELVHIALLFWYICLCCRFVFHRRSIRAHVLWRDWATTMSMWN